MKLQKNTVMLFAGDSITHGNRGLCMDGNHIMGHGYQYIVAGKLASQNLDTKPKFANKGWSGYTMEMLYERWQEDVLAVKPNYISILAGINDCHQGFCNGRSIDETVTRFTEALTGAVTDSYRALPGVKMILCEPFFFPLPERNNHFAYVPHPECEPPFYGEEDTPESIAYRAESCKLLQTVTRETASKYGCLFVPFACVLQEAIDKSCNEYIVWDGTHPTVAGHVIMAEQWLSCFEKGMNRDIY